jgi:hypothetical protein
MYSAKRAAAGGVHTFTPGMQMINSKELDLPREQSGMADSAAEASAAS